MPKELGKKLRRGIIVVLLEEGWVKLAGFGATVILSRLLAPRDFGLIATAYVVVNFLRLFVTRGISHALIQNKEIDDEYVATGLFAYFITGIFLALMLFFAAPGLSYFFGNPAFTAIFRFFSLALLIQSVSSVPQALLRKRLNFIRASIPSVAERTAYWFVAVVLAYLGFGVWSFVWAFVISSLIAAALNWSLCSLRIHGRPVGLKLRKLLSFGIPALLAALWEYVAANIDYFIIAKFLGPAALGFYFLAFEFSSFFYATLCPAFGSVLFPAFSSLSDQRQIRSYYLKVVLYLSMVILPFYAGACLLNREVIFFVYGTQWLAAAPLLGILSMMGIVKGLGMGGVNRDVLYAQGKVYLSLQVRMLFALLNSAAVLIGLLRGTAGIAFAVTVAAVINSVVIIRIVIQSVDISWKQYFGNLVPSLVATMVMSAVILFLKKWSSGHIFSFAQLVFMGMGVYIGSLLLLSMRRVPRGWWKNPTFEECLSNIRNLR